jgi:hypothetical protein
MGTSVVLAVHIANDVVETTWVKYSSGFLVTLFFIRGKFGRLEGT